ncbi:MAG TPA: NAD(P)/FAD-dependent oxidoreductase [Marmoricola sp.]|nr:NAD(P)/FAD-dependent oxidoreductase [Marmoricola sp.]
MTGSVGPRWDAIVVGSGPNGLVAANHLADKGWSVLLLEAEPEIGGAVHSSRELDPDFVHDTFSAFYPLAVASPAIRSLDLEQHGLRWTHAPAVVGHPLPEGGWSILSRDLDVTADGFDALSPGDGDAWRALAASWEHVGEQLLGAMLTPFPPVRHGLGTLAKLPGAGGLDFLRTLVTPVDELGRQHFSGPAPRLLLAGNAAHADIPTNATGSGLMGLLMAMLGQTVGFPVPVGGAGELAGALGRRFRALGGQVRCGARVERIEVSGGRASAVRLDDGEVIEVRRAVVADVSAYHLYGGLIDPADLPARTRRAMGAFELDPGTVKVDWALDGPVPWADPPPVAPGTVHVADSLEELSRTYTQLTSGAVPDRPFLIAGQMTTTDATRSPAGTESMWAYSHVPQQTRRDAGDGSVRGTWDEDDRERYADRMQQRLEALAPGFSSRIRVRRVLGPRELEGRNANLVGGAINGGTAQLHQELVFRPIPGLGRAETPVRGVYLGSASAHPGGGVHGAAGMNAARAALFHERLGHLVRRR